MADQPEPRAVAIANFTVVQLGTTKVLLDDGTQINMQLVPVRLTKMDQFLPDGQPMYTFQCQQLIDQIPPDGKILPETLKKGV